MTIMYSNRTGISGPTLPARKIPRFLTARIEKGCWWTGFLVKNDLILGSRYYMGYRAGSQLRFRVHEGLAMNQIQEWIKKKTYLNFRELQYFYGSLKASLTLKNFASNSSAISVQ